MYIRSSKSHSDRLAELNLKTILSEIPNGNDYRILGNGRLVKKDLPVASGSSTYQQRRPEATYASVAAPKPGGAETSQQSRGMSSSHSQHVAFVSNIQHRSSQGQSSPSSGHIGTDSQVLMDFGSQPAPAQQAATTKQRMWNNH